MSDILTSNKNLVSFINSIKMVSDDEAYNMICQYKENPNQELEFEIFKQYSKFIYRRVSKFYSRYINNAIYDITDLFQEGYFGFKIALDKYDINSNNKFLTYAQWWIDKHIKDFTSYNHFQFTVSRPVAEELKSVAYYINKNSDDGITITKNDIKEKFNTLSNTKCEIFCDLLQQPIYLDESINDETDNTKVYLFNFDPEYDNYMATIDRNERLDYYINRLCKKRDADMIRMKYGLPPYTHEYSMTYIGKKYNVTRQYVAANVKKSVEKLYLRLEKHEDSYNF